MLLDGQDLVPKWTLGATQVLRYCCLVWVGVHACSGPQRVLLTGRGVDSGLEGLCDSVRGLAVLGSVLVTGGASEAAGHKY